MLRTPPGIDKRNDSSKFINEAGAVFDSLYKKYISTENIQKQAENYLLKSLYNKTVLKQKPPTTNSADSSSSELTGSREATGARSNSPTGGKSVDITKLVDYYQNLPHSVRGNAVQPGKPPVSKLKHRVSFEGQEVAHPLENSNSPTSNGGQGLSSPLSPHNLHTLRGLNRLGSDNLSDISEETQVNNYIKIQKNPPKGRTGDGPNKSEFDTFDHNKSGQDTSQENLEDFDEYFNSPPSAGKKHTKYYSSVQSKRRDVYYISAVCVLLQSLLFVALLTAFLLLNAYILTKPIKTSETTGTETTNSTTNTSDASANNGDGASGAKETDPRLRGTKAAGGDGVRPNSGGSNDNSVNSGIKKVIPLRNGFVNVSFPFILHFVLFYMVFNSADEYLRRKQLLYTNDITIEVMKRRLNRESSFSKLNNLTYWFDKAFLVFGVVIACFPFAGTYNLALWTYTEFVYIGLVGAFFVLHIFYSIYYFNFKFIDLVISDKREKDNF